MSQVKLPDLDGSTLYFTSDYSGYERKSKYWVYSLLIVDIDKCTDWEIMRRRVRNSFLGDKRRMSFKNLNDCKRLRALEPFLSAASRISGLCVCIAQTKKMNHSFFDRDKLDQLKSRINIDDIHSARWNAESLNNMWTIVAFIAIFIAGLAKPKQNIYWVSDEDDIFANPQRSADTAKLLSALTSMYVDFNLGELGIMTTKVDEGDRFEEDLNAISDLSAGAIAELLNQMSLTGSGKVRVGLVYPMIQNISKKTEIITTWLSNNDCNLSRLTFLLEEAHEGMFGIARLFIE